MRAQQTRRGTTTPRGEFTLTIGHEPTLWLSTRLRVLHSDIVAGNITHCGHLATRGVLAIAAFWRPFLAVCPDCSDRLALAGAQDRTCDRCGHHDADGVYLSAVRPGPGLLVLLGLCETCQRKEAAK